MVFLLIQVERPLDRIITMEAEINQLRNKLNLVVEELEVTREDNATLSRELEQQQVAMPL